MTHRMLAIRLRNRIRRLDPTIDASRVHNVRVNGAAHGCSGFLHDPETGRFVYVTTDVLDVGDHRTAYARHAASDTDTTGGANHWCDEERLAETAVRLLRDCAERYAGAGTVSGARRTTAPNLHTSPIG